VVKLIAKTACAGLLPVTIGTVRLTEVVPDKIQLIAPFKGQKKATSDALKAALGVSFPSPNRSLPAQVVDHSDAWAIVRIDGTDAAAVLARLTPIDIRDGVFKNGHTARTLVAHMTASITRVGVNAYEIMVMRSMAGTLVHDLEQAAHNVASRSKS